MPHYEVRQVKNRIM